MLEPLGKYETAMVVTAHPDDAEFGCSGTVARWISEGTQVVYVLVTDGSKGTEDRSCGKQEQNSRATCVHCIWSSVISYTRIGTGSS